MYYPYFRGKQFELITIREMSQLLAEKEFIPVIEPVRESLGGLKRTLSAVCDAGGRAIVIVNPYHGDHQEDGTDITDLLQEDFKGLDNISAGILLRTEMTVDEVLACYGRHVDHHPVLIHAGFTAHKVLAMELGKVMAELTNIFIEDHANTLYRKHFEGSTRILIRDGFKRRKNSEFAKVPVEPFSELHLTFRSDLGMNGFGDFLTVGDAYSDGGGPAYAVAIHLTFIDPDADGVMNIYHFVSTTNDTPTDPAGKFAQALAKLIEKLDGGASNILETSAIQEFRSLHAKGHFPGLGYVKKLSMKHHIETLAA
ncbi:sce7725 family protein [Achromobacter denitrificans]|uniref:sce7725 family protein n=1 Tax=Achromobacter denitrificans TaxID=32002 RepID=UPI0023E7FB7C|nr:sce7725 family protein [Achromobacter denitrificans]MDF3862700.1 sce7725 family protein [Achromobacter denitrificans]